MKTISFFINVALCVCIGVCVWLLFYYGPESWKFYAVIYLLIVLIVGLMISLVNDNISTKIQAGILFTMVSGFVLSQKIQSDMIQERNQLVNARIFELINEGYKPAAASKIAFTEYELIQPDAEYTALIED